MPKFSCWAMGQVLNSMIVVTKTSNDGSVLDVLAGPIVAWLGVVFLNVGCL